MTRNVVRESFIYPGVNSIQNNSFFKISLNNVHVDQCRKIFHLKSRSLTANSENDPHPSHPKGCLDQGLIHPPGLFVELGRAKIGNYTSRKGVGGREALPPPPPFRRDTRTIVFLMCFIDYQGGVVRAKNVIPLVFRKRWSLDVQLATFTCAIPVIEQDTQ